MTPENGHAKQLNDGIADTLVSVKLLEESTASKAIGTRRAAEKRAIASRVSTIKTQ
jgi:hypothetical protein